MNRTAAKILAAFAIAGCAPAPSSAPEGASLQVNSEYFLNKDGTKIIPCIVIAKNDSRGTLFNSCSTPLQVTVKEFLGNGKPNKMEFIAQPKQYFYNPNEDTILFSHDMCDQTKGACRPPAKTL